MENNNKSIQNTPDNIDKSIPLWNERNFKYPKRTIRLATAFSGIGAIKHAFQRLGLKT